MENKYKELGEIIERISIKYARMVEKRIDDAKEGLMGQDLRDIYDGVQLLGNVISTLERFGRMDNPT